MFPQYKFATAKGNTEKSDEATLEISMFVLDTININGYILEKDIKISGKVETQWKKSIQEILDTYGLVRVRATNENKIKYSIPSDIPYQSFVICKENNHS